MIELKTVLRGAGIAMLSLWSTTALAQSVLNFTGRGGGAAGITNPSPYAADVKFTLYNPDGSLAAGILNPISQRIPGKGQIVDYYQRLFGAAPNGWVQVTSPVSGLQGFYFTGDTANTFDTEATTPQQAQILSYGSSSGRTFLIVTNPSTQSATVTVVFYDRDGNVVEGPPPFPLASHAQLLLTGAGASAMVSSNIGVLASAVQETNGLQVLINGQGERARAQRLVAPLFDNEAGVESSLVLTNPSSQDAQIRVSVFTSADAKHDLPEFVLRPNASIALDWGTLSSASGSPDAGWLVVDASRPISGLVLVATQTGRTALPLQSSPVDRMLFSRFIDDADLTAHLSLVGNVERDAVVTVTLSRPDGTTVAKNEIPVPALKRVAARIRDLVPVPDSFPQGFVTIQSTVPIYGVEILAADNAFDAAQSPLRLPLRYQPGPAIPAPRILNVLSQDTLDGRKQLRIVGENFDSNALLYVGGKLVPILSIAATDTQTQAFADFPQPLEPGFINVKIRANGIDSNAFPLGVYPDGAIFLRREGQALFQKVEVTTAGLDLSRTVMVPIRNARVEIIDRATGKPLSVSETNDEGRFVAAVPDRAGLAIQVLSRLRSSEVKVLDNTAGNRPYLIRKDFDDPQDSLLLMDTSRVSGAFNILDLIQRANMLVAQADPQLLPPPITIFWSEKNNDVVLSRFTGGAIKTTFFNLATNTAYVLGDRNTDSDEFDDSVILHEYAHMLAGRFSRDDSPGGAHVLGDVLDPRLAWSEGWANFFSSAVRGTPIFIDSKGPGVVGVRYDLEENSPAGDIRGYWSEASVQGLLWDLFDEAVDDGDSVIFPFSAIWNAFTELRNDRYVYVPDFLEHFVRANPGASDAVRTMAMLRTIDFQPDARPSVWSSFPRSLAVGETTQPNELDSFTSKRTNLAKSSHFYSFNTTNGGQASIILNIDGLGPANNPDANDLDLFLYDSNGKRITQSDQALNGQPEYIFGRLSPGTYYVEVRSYYTRAETSSVVFNSGRYRLSLQLQ